MILEDFIDNLCLKSNNTMPSNTTEMTESFILLKECEDNISRLKERVQGQAEWCPIPSVGYIINFPSVYGCNNLAAHTVLNTLKVGCSY